MVILGESDSPKPDRQGMDCYANDREALADFQRFFNNSSFSDVTLLVGEEIFYAHRLILIKASEVFERMLSQQWNGDKKQQLNNNTPTSKRSTTPGTESWGNIEVETLNIVLKYRFSAQIELVEDRVCAKVFPAFLRYLYCNHIVLHTDNTLPILILADKYNVASLRKVPEFTAELQPGYIMPNGPNVCIDYAVNNIIPTLSLKDIFHIWFQYGTKCFHQELINICIGTLANSCDEMISSSDWEKDWLEMDRDQLYEFLKCSDLNIKNEFDLWQAVSKWIQAPSHPERRGSYAEKTLAHIVPLIRFPFMTPDELSQIEASPLVNQYPKIFNPHIMSAYKFQALPLTSRVGCRDFTGLQCLLRNYSELRWDKRIIVPEVASMLKYTEYTIKLVTRASAVPVQNWDWELKVHPKGFSSSQEDFKYSADLEMEKRVGIEEIMADNSPLLVNDSLQLQLTLKPID